MTTRRQRVFSQTKNPRPNYQTHGIKLIGSYYYNLLINMDGEVIIERIKTDKTEILYTLKPEGTSIATFWATPADSGYNYTYLYQIA